MITGTATGGRPPVRTDGGPERRRQMIAELRAAVDAEELRTAEAELLWVQLEVRRGNLTDRALAGPAARWARAKGLRIVGGRLAAA